MRSALYACTVAHTRFFPKKHRFSHRVFLLAVDLDEWSELHRRLRLLSCDAANLYSLRDEDFLPTAEPVHRPSGPEGTPPPGARLKERVLHWANTRGVAAPPDSRVTLVAMPRAAGHLFNPVAFYFITSPTGEPLGAIAEVTNTFREIKAYALGPEHLRHDGRGRAYYRRRCPKDFYVSPFSPPDGEFEFVLHPPDETLRLRVDHHAFGKLTLTAPVSGTRATLTDATLLRETLICPAVTLKAVALIHLHALILWLKRLPWWPKSAAPERQNDLRRPAPAIAAQKR